jgi:hypothetical protein
MAIIHEQELFSWKDLENLGDLERLKLIIEHMPDERLMKFLEENRYKGRNDYPIRAVWNSILAGIVYQHESIASLIRELKRNAQLREICGFSSLKGIDAVPTKSSYSRFLNKLLNQEDLIEEIFNHLVKKLSRILPDFGKNLAFDGKAISSLSPNNNKENQSSNDKRKENDADWGVKKYKGIDQKGNLWEKIKKWFGFKIHLIVDADYELPVAFNVTKASLGEQPIMHKLFSSLEKEHPQIIESCEHAMGDKGYDGAPLIKKLWDEYKIKPIIDIKNMKKDGETSWQFNTLNIQNVTYDYKGNVFCHSPITGKVQSMAFSGFEKDRDALKYLCPARHYDMECEGQKHCPLKSAIRIPLEEDRRVFTPVARSSYKWKDLYKKRTSVERVNSRLDVSFGFERHYIRGLKKMKVRCSIALCVMLAMALGRAKQNQLNLMRSLLRTA